MMLRESHQQETLSSAIAEARDIKQAREYQCFLDPKYLVVGQRVDFHYDVMKPGDWEDGKVIGVSYASLAIEVDEDDETAGQVYCPMMNDRTLLIRDPGHRTFKKVESPLLKVGKWVDFKNTATGNRWVGARIQMISESIAGADLQFQTRLAERELPGNEAAAVVWEWLERRNPQGLKLYYRVEVHDLSLIHI